MKRPIAPGLAPNMEVDDVWVALRTFFTPWKWKNGNSVKQVEEWFKDYFHIPYAVSFNSGRVAELAILSALGIGEGDAVLVQAFTCVAVPNSVLWAGATPIYIDCDKSFNLDPIDIEKKITKKTKAIIVQHTFGIPADMDAITKIAKKHKLYIIEDCAHALGSFYKGKKLGTLGDAAFFSFGRDKMISSVFGGVAVTNNAQLGKKLEDYQKSLSYSSSGWIFQQLMHPISFSVILPLYDMGVGKLLLLFLQKLELLPFPVYPEEKKGKKPVVFPAKYPNVLAELLLNQLGKLEYFTRQRKKTAKFYFEKLSEIKEITLPSENEEVSFLRFPLLVSDPISLIQAAKKYHIYLGDWYRDPIAPKDVSYSEIEFDPKKTPHAIKLSEHVVNLPTYPTMSNNDRERVVDFFKQHI